MIPALVAAVVLGFGAPDGPASPASSGAAGQDDPFRVAAVELRGLDVLEPPVGVPRPLPLREGDLYTSERLSATEDHVAAAFAERGRPYVVVELSAELDRAARTARVVVEVVDPGPRVRFGAVRIDADPPLAEEVVRERVAFASGDLFRPSRLEITRERLLMLEVVRDAGVAVPGLVARDTVVEARVVVAAVERPRAPTVGGTFSSARCLEIEGFWQDRHFLGGPRFLSLGGGGGNLLADALGGRFPCSDVGEGELADPSYFLSGEIRQPWPGDPLLSVSLRGFLRRDPVARAYVLREAGGRIGARRVFRREFVVDLSYFFTSSEIEGADFYFCINFGVCAGEEVRLLAQARRHAFLEGGLEWMPVHTREARRPARFVEREEALPPRFTPPRWHPWIRTGLSGADRFIGSEHRYIRIRAEAGASRSVGDRMEVAVRGRAGWVSRGDRPLPPQVRFLSGGPHGVRGAQASLLGPRTLLAEPEQVEAMGCEPVPGGCPEGTVADPDLVRLRPRGGHLLAEGSVEGRLQVTGRLQLAAFVDYGLLEGEPPRDDGPGVGGRREAMISPGAGIRLRTPVGLVRLDAAYDSRGPRLLPLLVPRADPDEIVSVGTVLWDPAGHDDPPTLRRLLRRFQVSLALGQPF